MHQIKNDEKLMQQNNKLLLMLLLYTALCKRLRKGEGGGQVARVLWGGKGKSSSFA